MRTRLIVSFLLGASFISGFACHERALAQISTNLDALPPSPSPSSQAPQTAPHRSHITPRTPEPRATENTSVNATIAAAHKAPPSPPGYTTIPSVPSAPPKNIVIAPAFVPVQKHPPVPPEEVKADPTAKSSFNSIDPNEKRVLFEAQSAKINQATLDSINDLAKNLAEHPTQRIRLESYAAGVDDDASMPRRISLERAIIIRSLLMLNHVASTRIYPIAHGLTDPSDKNPPDRVDIHILENPVKIAPGSDLLPSPSAPATHKEGAKTP